MLGHNRKGKQQQQKKKQNSQDIHFTYICSMYVNSIKALLSYNFAVLHKCAK